MESTITLGDIWTVVAWMAAAIVLIVNAAEKVAKIVQAAKSPNAQQDARLQALEEQQRKTDEYLRQDNTRLESIEKSNAVTQRALLALLGHGLHGNNVEQMHDAEVELQNHLINR